MHRIYDAPNSLIAHHLVLLLRNAGIEAEVRGECIEPSFGFAPVAGAKPSVWIVDERQGADALAIVRDFEGQAAKSSDG